VKGKTNASKEAVKGESPFSPKKEVNLQVKGKSCYSKGNGGGKKKNPKPGRVQGGWKASSQEDKSWNRGGSSNRKQEGQLGNEKGDSFI